MSVKGEGWSEERVELLKKLWIQGLSASQIAKELGSTTRNAVIGKIHRLDLVARQNPKMTPPASSVKSKAPISSISVKAPAPRRSDYMPPSVAFEQVRSPLSARLNSGQSGSYDLDSGFGGKSGLGVHNPFKTGSAQKQCQWPVGDPRSVGFRFCGACAAENLPYCPEHAQLAYQPSARKRINMGNADLHSGGTPDEREIVVRV